MGNSDYIIWQQRKLRLEINNMNTSILPAIAVAIFNKNGEILLQKRRDTNKWCVISGHVDFGESVEQAVIREIKEETNCSSTINRFIGIYSSPSSQTYQRKNAQVQYVTLYFEAELTSPVLLNYKNAETGELKFFNADALPQDLDTINPYWLKDALSGQQSAFVR